MTSVPTPDKRPDVAGIEARVKAAFHGPWEDLAGKPRPEGWEPAPTFREAENEFLVHARQDIPALIAYIEALEARQVKLEAATQLGLQCALMAADLGAEDGDEIAGQIRAALGDGDG